MKKRIDLFAIALVVSFVALLLAIPHNAKAHCDTLDGPVVQDAQKAIDAKDITPVLKWVRQGDEGTIRTAFDKVLAVKGDKKAQTEAQHQFFSHLVEIHRAGEGAPFTGLKPAGEVEPAVAEADKALAAGSSDGLVKLIVEDVAAGIRSRYEKAAAAYRHKDESVAQGREFVEAYVEFTHYVERVHADVVGKGGHAEHQEEAKHALSGHKH